MSAPVTHVLLFKEFDVYIVSALSKQVRRKAAVEREEVEKEELERATEKDRKEKAVN